VINALIENNEDKNAKHEAENKERREFGVPLEFMNSDEYNSFLKRLND
jgi:hypothetical protein